MIMVQFKTIKRQHVLFGKLQFYSAKIELVWKCMLMYDCLLDSYVEIAQHSGSNARYASDKRLSLLTSFCSMCNSYVFAVLVA